MKGRPFLAVLLVIALLALGLGWGGWWLVWRRGPLRLQHHTLTVPRAARFVPRQAPLSLFLFSDGDQPVDYVRAVAPLRQREAATQTVERLRDGAFAAAGLDYHDELAHWLAPEMGLALFDTPDNTSPDSGWLLVLSSRDGEGARRFLQRFWQSRSLAGSGLQVSQYRGMGLISGRGALVGRDPVPLATALVQDDLVLLASGRTTLERALDVSQIDELNQAGLSPLRQGVEQLGEGMALLVARSGAFGPWLGWPALEGGEGKPGTLLVGTLQPRGRELVFEGLLHLPPATPAESPPSVHAEVPPTRTLTAVVPPEESPPVDLSRALLQGLRGDSTSLALLHHPAALLQHPWLTPLLGRISHPPAGGPLPPLLVAADPELLLLSSGPEGWLIGTSGPTPRTESLEAPLAAQGLIEAPLEIGGESVTVWTRLQAPGGAAGRGVERDQLRASVAGWRQQTDGLAWWGGNLAQLNRPSASRSALDRQRQLAELAEPQAALRWALGREAAGELLQRWHPWTLLTSLAGGALTAGPPSLSVAIDTHTTPVHWIAHLHFATESHG
ncbi:MAG: DUF3352 domain-containing protein [Cyanobacteriota bacterium]|nr:DUF3352 domain-containing protein [Cyanobacteriota bacterium]